MQRLKNFITVGSSIALTALLVLHAGLVGAGGNAEVPVSVSRDVAGVFSCVGLVEDASAY